MSYSLDFSQLGQVIVSGDMTYTLHLRAVSVFNGSNVVVNVDPSRDDIHIVALKEIGSNVLHKWDIRDIASPVYATTDDLMDDIQDAIELMYNGGGGPAPITDVNGQGGPTVTLDANDVGAIPDPGSSTDNAIVRWNGGSGDAVQDSTFILNDDGSLTIPSVAAPAYGNGKLYYDSTTKALTFLNDNNAVSLQIGEEERVLVRNVSGSTIVNGAPVYFNGASGGLPTVALAQANSGTTTVCLGLATQAIANNTVGYVTALGTVHELDTSAFAIGNIYLSATTPGALTQTVPSAPNFRYRVGFVTAVSATVGTICVVPTTAALGTGIEGQRLIQGATGQTWGYTPMTISVLGASNAAWAAMPAASDFFQGVPNRNVFFLPMATFTQMQITVTVGATAGAAGSRLNLKYKTGASTGVIANYAHIGIGATEIAATTIATNTQTTSGWITIEPAARADIQLALCGEGSNGVAGPVFSMVLIQMR